MRNNSNMVKGEPSRGMARHPAVVAAQQGYAEALAGRPLNPDRFPTMMEQSNYEIGRLWALNLRAAGIAAPTWRRGTNRPAALAAMLALSFAAIGGCQPGEGDGRAAA